ncbi:hypothetical protein BGZ60DRAFT_420877 [Tricladium varicosporioides]|nr:hypothetical protein BGZ60DRAFT_420877 [Hymenoscyphus varicosporioides]
MPLLPFKFPMQPYAPLASEDNSNDHEKIITVQKNTKNHAVLNILLGLIVLNIVALVSISATTLRSPQPKLPSITSCGNTSTYARSNGCHFDVMSFSWLPPACYDEKLIEEFLAMESWKWFSDSEGTQPVPLETVQKGDAPQMYVSWSYHIDHCVFMWKKMHRALENDGPIDAYIGNYHHTQHCGHMLMMNQNETDTGDGAETGGVPLNTIIRRKFVGCGDNKVFII